LSAIYFVGPVLTLCSLFLFQPVYFFFDYLQGEEFIRIDIGGSEMNPEFERGAQIQGAAQKPAGVRIVGCVEPVQRAMTAGFIMTGRIRAEARIA